MLMLDPASILMLEVSRGLLLRFQTGNAGEDLPVQAFIPQLPIETLTIPVLSWTTWFDVQRSGPEIPQPLTRQVEREQTRLDQLRAQTWGVWLHEAEDGARSVVLPKETPLGKNWPWKVQGQPALLLSSE